MKGAIKIIALVVLLLLGSGFVDAYVYGYGMMGYGNQMMGYYGYGPSYGYPSYNYYGPAFDNVGYSGSFARTNYYSRFNNYRSYDRDLRYRSRPYSRYYDY